MIFDILFSTNITAEQAVIRFLIALLVILFSLSIHEFAHALTAHLCGDNTPKNSGRLTLNPFKHITPSGFFMFIFLGVGWAKPVPINPTNFKKYRKGIRWVSVAGVLANVALGLVSAVLILLFRAIIPASVEAMEYIYWALGYLMFINSFLAMFNLIPIYPLDGFNFVTSFMKSNNKFIHYSLKNGFKIVLTILVISLIFEVFFGIDLVGKYLSLLYDYIFLPISKLGV